MDPQGLGFTARIFFVKPCSHDQDPEPIKATSATSPLPPLRAEGSVSPTRNSIFQVGVKEQVRLRGSGFRVLGFWLRN